MLAALSFFAATAVVEAQVARVPPAKFFNSIQIYYGSATYQILFRQMYPFTPDNTQEIWRELTDTNTIGYIARANGLTAKDLSTVVIAPVHTNGLALFQISKADRAFNVLEGQLQEYVHLRREGHSRMYLLTALSDHWQESKMTDPDLRAIMKNQPWVAVSWLKKEKTGTYTNANQVTRWVAYTLTDGAVAWTCICEFKPSGQVESFLSERIDPAETNPQYKPIIRAIDAELEAQMKQQGTYGKLGTIHTFWQLKKEKLKARGIDWHSPAELNPGTQYD